MLALLCGNKNAGLFGRPPRLSGFLKITPPLSSLRSFRSNELMATCLFLKFCVYSETCTVEACKKRWLQEHSSSPWVAYLYLSLFFIFRTPLIKPHQVYDLITLFQPNLLVVCIHDHERGNFYAFVELTPFQNVPSPPSLHCCGRERGGGRQFPRCWQWLWQADQLKLCASSLTRSSRDYASAITVGFNKARFV